MQICMITNTYLPHVGGVARSVNTFTQKYRERGHGTLVVAPSFPEARKSSDNVIRLPAIQNFNGSDFSVRLPIPGFLYEAMEEFKPDLVHSHHPFLLGDTAVRVARQWEVPLVFTHHTLYERYTHYVPFNSKVMRDLAIKLATSYANLCSLVIAPSESIAKLLHERGVTAPLEIVPTGVDVDFFQGGQGKRGRKKFQLGKEQLVIGHVGRLAYEKNLEYLSRAVSTFLTQNKTAVFLVVGDGQARPKMTDIFQEYGVSDRVLMPGKQSGTDLADAYRAMDLFVFASTSETQGMVVAEAMAAGLPVVALDAPGVREVLQDGRNGKLLPPKTEASSFANTLLELTLPEEPREHLQTMSQNALKTARSFDKDSCVDTMLGHYEQLLLHNDRVPGRASQEVWRRILNGIAAEWELLTQKANTLSASISDENE